jgi:hypothetical protein
VVEDEDTDAEIIAVRPEDFSDIFVAIKVNVMYERKDGAKITHLKLTREDLARIMEARW